MLLFLLVPRVKEMAAQAAPIGREFSADGSFSLAPICAREKRIGNRCPGIEADILFPRSSAHERLVPRGRDRRNQS